MKQFPSRKFPTPFTRRGFTLIELLAVIAVIAVLVAILIPAVGGVREQANRAKCSSNIRQVGTAVIMIAQTHNENRFMDPGLNHPYHLRTHNNFDEFIVEELAMPKDALYCPSNTNWSGNNFYESYIAGNRGSLPIGYLIIAGNPRIADPNNKERDYPMSLMGREPFRSEMIVDLVVDAGGNFSGRTGHMSGPEPAGGFIMHVSGSVEWRPFSEMEAHPYVTGAGTFYW